MKSIFSKIPWALLALILVVGGCAGPSGQMKTSVEEAAVTRVLSVTGEDLPDRVRLTIEGTAPLAYTVFRLSEPLRLIVDLADTDVTPLGEEIPVAIGNVSSVKAIQFDEEAGKIGRLEVALVELWDYETSRMDNTIVVDFVKPVPAAEMETAEREPAEAEAPPAEPAAQPEVEVVELSLPEAAPEEKTPEAQEPQEEAALDPATTISRVLFYEEDGHFTVEFVGDGSVQRYDAMNLTGPTRLVVDIWDVTKGFKPRVIPVEMSGVNRIRVGEHRQEGKLRFVLDLQGDEVPPYNIVRRGEKLVVTLGVEAAPAIEVTETPETVPAEPVPRAAMEPPPAAPAAVERNETPAPAALPAGPAVTDIRYVRYEMPYRDSAVLVLADAPVDFTVTQADATHILVDLRGIVLPRDLVRSQDTRDQGGPLQALSSYNPKGADGARVSMTVERGTQYKSELVGSTLTIELTSPEPTAPPMAAEAPPEPVRVEAAAPVQQAVDRPVPTRAAAVQEEKVIRVDDKPKYTGELITMDFQNADILNVLRLIAEVSGLNIITSDKVKGNVSMRMVNVPWDQALEVILKTKGLGQVREGNVVRIAPQADLDKERADALKTMETEDEFEELILKIVPLSYAKADEIKGQLTPFLGPRGSINIDKRTNALIVKDIEGNIAKIEELIAELDIPTPQVRIEARIVIVDESYTRNLGIQWGGVYESGDLRVFGDSAAGNTLVNLPAANPITAIGFDFGTVGNFTELDLRLSALEQMNKGRIISSPSFLVIQNETALIEVNNPFPENRTSTEVTEEGTTTTTSVSFSDIVTKLEITPQVTSNRDIFMEVFVEKDSKGQQATFDNNIFTGVNTHKLETKIIVEDTGTAVIGGVYTESEKTGRSSVPFFHKIPLLGWLFKNKARETSREELLIFINATIVEE